MRSDFSATRKSDAEAALAEVACIRAECREGARRYLENFPEGADAGAMALVMHLTSPEVVSAVDQATRVRGAEMSSSEIMRLARGVCSPWHRHT